MRYAAAAAALLVLSACAAPGPAPGQLTPVSDDVRAAYLAYWDAWLGASRTSDPDDATLAARTREPNLDVVRSILRDARDRHEIAVGTVTHAIRGMDSFGDARRVVDCVDVRGWIVLDARTDEPIDQLADRPSQLGAFTLVRDGSRWTVAYGQILGDC
jgi:hypothetical protein